MKLVICLILLTMLSSGSFARRFNTKYQQYYSRNLRRETPNTPPPTYLLITTSSKIYSMRIPASFNYAGIDLQQRENEVIYSESGHLNNWITDAFYVKSEDLIYVNVYNSTSYSSNIFTLKYNRYGNKWEKKVLYKDQSYCLGITYNEAKKELYWTAAKSVMAGSTGTNQTYKVIFELNRTKKLLYLKYDHVKNVIYVSTLNYVYECSVDREIPQNIYYTEKCRVISRNLVSARGLYIDDVNRQLYVIDHKNRKINRISLKKDMVKKNVNSHIDNQVNDQKFKYFGLRNDKRDSLKPVTTLVSQNTLPNLGDIFYMCIYNKSNEDILIWSEFSGQIKAAKMNDLSNSKTLFSTNEYTYSISLMDNSTEQATTTKAPTTASTTTETTKPQIDIKTSTALIKISTESDKSILGKLTEKPETNDRLENSFLDYEKDLIDEEELETDDAEYEAYEYKVDDDIDMKKVETDEEKEEKVISLETKSLRTSKDKLDQETTFEEKEFRPMPNILTVGSRKFIIDNEETSMNSNLINAVPTKSKTDLLRSTSTMNAALYIVICLLCFSLFINIILLYISKIKHNKSKQLIISHEICDIKTLPNSNRCGSTLECSSRNECNLNLINSSGSSATSVLDSDN